MKKVTIEVTWKGDVTFEVDDDWQCPSTLDGFSEEQLEEMTPVLAELVDWDLIRTRFDRLLDS
jgi:hypothetical protein